MNLSLKIYFIFTLVFICVQSQTTKPALIECTTKDLVCPIPIAGVDPQPICAWFNSSETKCQNTACNQNIDMVCNACYLPGIIGYTLGKCPESDPIIDLPVTSFKCDEIRSASDVCATDATGIRVYEPVCAYYSCSKDPSYDGKCSQTFASKCLACQDENVIYVVTGECPEDPRIIIDPLPPIDLYPIDPLPPIEPISIIPFPISLPNPIHQCPTKICPRIWKPVCGWFDAGQIQCIKYPCAQTFSNSCLACKDPKVIGFTPGPCPTTPIVIADPVLAAVDVATTDAKAELIKIDTSVSPSITPFPVDYICTTALKTGICTKIYDPVCAIILDIAYCKSIGQATPCYLTYSNSCIACHDPKVHAFNYYLISNGKCPKAPASPYPSNMVRCIKKSCPRIYAPVCAIQLPCSKTYSNSCFACLNGNTLGYTNGPCPHTLPILDSFDKYTCLATDRFNDVSCNPVQGYNYVCAYLNYKCTYGQCTTYSVNRCEACHNAMVVSVTPGLCPNEQKWFKGVKSYVCKDEDRNTTSSCPDFDTGVCAIKTQGIGSYPNVCTACKDENVIEVFNKACPTIN